MTLLVCAAGHTNPEGANVCGVCGAPVHVASESEIARSQASPTAIDPADAPAVKRAHEVLAAYWASGVGQAREAWDRGDTLFEMVVPAVSTERTTSSLIWGDTTTQRTVADNVGLLTAIESGGWKLEHCNYVFEQTGSVSRDKFMSSGQVQNITGRVLGFYVFRRRPDTDDVRYVAPEEILDQVRFLEKATGEQSVRFPEIRNNA